MRQFDSIIFTKHCQTNRKLLGQDINPKYTTQWSAMQQRNVSLSTVGIVIIGYALPSSDMQ